MSIHPPPSRPAPRQEVCESAFAERSIGADKGTAPHREFVGVGVRSMGGCDAGESQGVPAEVETPYYAQGAVA